MAGRRPGGGAAEAGEARLPAACGGGRPAAAGGLRPGRPPAGLVGLAVLAEGEREKDGSLRGLQDLRRGREPGAARPPQAGSTGFAPRLPPPNAPVRGHLPPQPPLAKSRRTR